MMKKHSIRILCIGAGNMGRSHALAYHRLDGFEIVGIVTRSPQSRAALNQELGGNYPEYADVATALAESRPDAVSISSYPDTHAAYATAALEAGCHVFLDGCIRHVGIDGGAVRHREAGCRHREANRVD